MELRRFSLEFETNTEMPRVPFGCGVTATTVDDALGLVAETFCDGHRPAVRKIVEDVDVGELADELAPRGSSALVW